MANGQFQVADVVGNVRQGQQFAVNLDQQQALRERQAQLAPLQFQSAQLGVQQQQQQLSQAEQRSALERNIQTALELKSVPDNQKSAVMTRKISEGEAAGRDMSQSKQALELINAGRFEELAQGGDQLIEIGQRFNILKAPQKQSFKAEELDLERQRLAQQATSQQFKEEQAGIKSSLLSPTVQGILDKSQTESIGAAQRSRSLSVLADDVSKLDIGGGLAASTSETFKNLLGAQDDVSELRRRYNAIRASQAVQNLPPGPASDKDIALALSGFPKENAGGQQLISFLKGAAKLEGINAAFQAFKSDLISETRSTKGLLKTWKSKVPSSALGRDITMSELFITAQEEGVSVDELKEQLGVE